MELTAQEKAILDFEQGWWLEGSSKQTTIRERLGLSATRYYQVLGVLIDVPAALDYDPLLVRRLRRVRLERRNVRLGGRPIEERSRP
jgi:Protein of unknown function (DUF3263)